MPTFGNNLGMARQIYEWKSRRTNILAASEKTLNHVLARLIREALLSLENDNTPAVN